MYVRDVLGKNGLGLGAERPRVLGDRIAARHHR